MIRSQFVGLSGQYQCFLHTVTVWVGITIMPKLANLTTKVDEHQGADPGFSKGEAGTR